MGKVARQVVEQAGVDLKVLIGKLIRATGAEFTTFYYYTILRVNSIGFEGEGLKEIIEDARIEDRNHFEALTPRNIRTYTEICNQTFGKDHRTYDIALAILHKEVEHEA